MKDMMDTTFINYIRDYLENNGLIENKQSIKMTPWHFITVNGEQCSHYLVECEGKKFFLKTVKDEDNTIFCLKCLDRFKETLDLRYFPQLVANEFSYNQAKYYFLNYIEGETLEDICEKLSDSEWIVLADGIKKRIDTLKKCKANSYFENGHWCNKNYGDVLIDKLNKRLDYPLNIKELEHNKTYIINKFKSLLKYTLFPKTSLIHMDVKPGNIIFNRKTNGVYLIDFELARFCDVDYGNVQVLLTKYKGYNQKYSDKVITRLIENFTLENAVHDNKCLCYLFYQCLCNLIFYDSRKLVCPNEMRMVFDHILYLFLNR